MKNLPEYSSLEEKQQFFAAGNKNTPWIINTEEEFDKFYDFLTKENNKDFETCKNSLFFRGVNEARYKTYTSAQRNWLTNEWEDDTRNGFINYIQEELRKIKSWGDLRNYYLSLGITPNDILYLAYLQHFGGGTPLLDITHSLDTGLFFAFYKIKAAKESEPVINQYVTLQIFKYDDYSSHFSKVVEVLNEGIFRAKNMIDKWKENHPLDTADISLIEKIEKITAWHNPSNPEGSLDSVAIGLLDFVKGLVVRDLKGRSLYWSNIRLIAQRGAFLLYTDPILPLEEYFRDKINVPLIRAVHIRKDLRDYVMGKIPELESRLFPSEGDIVKDANCRAIMALKLKDTTSRE